VAAAIEAMGAAAPQGHLRALPARAPRALALARSCYDHIAGRLGVLIAERLAEGGALLSRGGDFALTPRGMAWLGELGLDLEALQRGSRPLVRQCLDWTERRFHLAGALGGALRDHFLADGWLERQEDSRLLSVTARGADLLERKLGVVLDHAGAEPVPEGGRAAAR